MGAGVRQASARRARRPRCIDQAGTLSPIRRVLRAQGSGKQQRGALVNLVAFYVFALPLSLALGFGARMGVVGLFLGMGAGPVVQSVLYAAVVGRMDWRKEAAKARPKP